MRRLLALAVLAAMLVLPPSALSAWGFSEWTILDPWSPGDVRWILAALTLVGWVAWALWVAAVVVEAAALVRRPRGGRPLLSVPALSGPRALASTLLGLILASGAAGAAQAQPVPPVHATVRVDADPVEQQETSPAGVTGVAETAEGDRRHVVMPGDDLWSLAARYYASGQDWRVIAEANLEALGGDPLTPLQPGMRLEIPSLGPTVTVLRGDTLSGLAEQHLGDDARWPEIQRLNRDVVADPDVIDVGWRLRLPGNGAPVHERDAPDVVQASPPDAVPTAGDPTASVPRETLPTTPAGPEPAPTNTPGREPAPTQPDGPRAYPDAEASPHVETDDDLLEAVRLVGGLSTLTSAAILGGLEVRRRRQQRNRPPGRRFVQPDDELGRYTAALARLSVAEDDGAVDRPTLVNRALRLLAHHWWNVGQPAPRCASVTLGASDVVIAFEGAVPSLPDPFMARSDGCAVAPWAALRTAADPDHCAAYPGLVTLGEGADGCLRMTDAVSVGVLGVTDHGEGLAADALAAMIVELAGAPWAQDLHFAVVGGDARFVAHVGDERVDHLADAETGVREVERLVRERGRFMQDVGAWDAARLDPDLADAWAPHVLLFAVPLTAEQTRRVREVVEGSRCGVAAIVPVDADAGVPTWTLTGGATPSGVLGPAGQRLTPQTLPSQTREALTTLHRLADARDHQPAPWWGPSGEDDVNIIALHPATPPADAPRLGLLGPIRLEGATGPEPARAARQCLEYCAWLLEHPGATAVQMTRALLIADGTRRSNMSRLRSWLGQDADGRLYLPEAYSGRIELHEHVTSDWLQVRMLIAGGVPRASTERLTLALQLVRGAPLADAAPGQWHWAEELRTDMAATVRDIALVLAPRLRERGDLEAARWAANRGLVANPDDERLLTERVRIESAAGRPDEVHRLVARLHRQARVLGVDLLPETVDLCQEVLEGRLRARQA